MSGPAAKVGQTSSRFRKSLRDNRLLIIVFSGAIGMGLWEFTHQRELVNLQLDVPQNFTDTVAELYPDEAGVQLMKARQLTLCMQAIAAKRPLPEPCRQFMGKNPLREARKFYQHGIASSKHLEDLYYDYLVFLIATASSTRQIDEAYDDWRQKFPLSTRPDPRTSARR